MRYVGGVDEQGHAIDVRDPLAARLKDLSRSAETPEAKVSSLLSVAEVFPGSLAADPSFRDALVNAYHGLLAEGARTTVARVAG
jgi:fructuronate reductase